VIETCLSPSKPAVKTLFSRLFFSQQRLALSRRFPPAGVLYPANRSSSRAFKELMDQKGWDAPDILMERQTINLP
jgi:hypothetical protein